jgi:hypothetical protein
VVVALMDSTTGLTGDRVVAVARAVLAVVLYNRTVRLVGLVMMVDPVVGISTITTKTADREVVVPVHRAQMADHHTRVSLQEMAEPVFHRFRLMALLIAL